MSDPFGMVFGVERGDPAENARLTAETQARARAAAEREQKRRLRAEHDRRRRLQADLTRAARAAELDRGVHVFHHRIEGALAKEGPQLCRDCARDAVADFLQSRGHCEWGGGHWVHESEGPDDPCRNDTWALEHEGVEDAELLAPVLDGPLDGLAALVSCGA